MQDEKELWSIAYMGAMLTQTLGRSARGTAFEKGHINDMDTASRALADKIVATVKEKAPKGK